MATENDIKKDLTKLLKEKAKAAYDATFPKDLLSEDVQKKSSDKFAEEFSKYASDEIDVMLDLIQNVITVDISKLTVSSTGSITGEIKLKLKK